MGSSSCRRRSRRCRRSAPAACSPGHLRMRRSPCSRRLPQQQQRRRPRAQTRRWSTRRAPAAASCDGAAACGQHACAAAAAQRGALRASGVRRATGGINRHAAALDGACRRPARVAALTLQHSRAARNAVTAHGSAALHARSGAALPPLRRSAAAAAQTQRRARRRQLGELLLHLRAVQRFELGVRCGERRACPKVVMRLRRRRR
ncbi:hypothetical protein JKP88DRAFT_225030 [Tribonema minus]|uniref:Uncharacterized protein n=1 Tax=Tribonema minus TaxID=303371 RepID=A0A836CBA6_9STRA|nr:hypothetical protein JKP88DRAFT_225030 [Tribonema minus]